MYKIPINPLTIEHRDDDGNLKYIEKGNKLCYQDGDDLKLSQEEFVACSEQQDIGKGIYKKVTTSAFKVGFSRNLSDDCWTIGIKEFNGNQYLTKLKGVVLYKPDTKEYLLIDTLIPSDFDENNLNDTVTVKYPNCLNSGDVEYVKYYGNFKQRITIEDKTTIETAITNNPTYLHFGVLTEVNSSDFINFLSDDRHSDIVKEIFIQDDKTYLIEYLPKEKLANGLIINYTTKGGALASDEVWTAGTYYITSPVVLGSYNLTINADVIVKSNYALNPSIDSTGIGIITVNGTLGHEVYFTSKNDDTVGEIIDGSTGIPITGDWMYIYDDSINDSVWNYTVFRYGGYANYGIFEFYYTRTSTMYWNNCILEHNCSVIDFYGAAAHRKLVMAECIFKDTHGDPFNAYGISNQILKFYHCIFWGAAWYNDLQLYAGTYTLHNCLFKRVGGYPSNSSIRVESGATLNIDNCTHDGYATISLPTITGTNGSTINIKNCILTNGGTALGNYPGHSATWNSDYNDCWNNVINFDITKGANDIEVDPKFLSHGSGDYDGYYLNQSTSPCIDSGSQTAVEAELDDRTTDPAWLVNDTGIVDRGWHYEIGISVSGGILKRWNGALWVKTKLKRWNGASWIDAILKRRDGTEWKEVDTSG